MINIGFPFKKWWIWLKFPFLWFKKKPANVTTEFQAKSGCSLGEFEGGEKSWMGKLRGFCVEEVYLARFFLLGGLYILVSEKHYSGSLYTDHTPITTATSRKSLPKMVVSAPNQTWMINLMMPLLDLDSTKMGPVSHSPPKEWALSFVGKCSTGAKGFVLIFFSQGDDSFPPKKNDIFEAKGTGNSFSKFQLSWYPLWGPN